MNNLTFLLVWSLVSFGITFSVTHGKLFKEMRKKFCELHQTLGQLVACPMCLGFWVGILLSMCWKSVTGSWVLDGFLSLSTCWLLYCLSWKLGLHDDRL
tara:strand:- start:98 stop:394 length:297 start_codon:yes stop_codon:yes gene_type:complete